MSSNADPHVAVVVLTWNGKADVLRRLATAPRVEYSNWSLTVVDNGSSDGTAEAIAAASRASGRWSWKRTSASAAATIAALRTRSSAAPTTCCC